MQRRRAAEPAQPPVANTREGATDETMPLWLAALHLAVLVGTFFALFWLAQVFIDSYRGVTTHDPQQMQKELMEKICPQGAARD